MCQNVAISLKTSDSSNVEAIGRRNQFIRQPRMGKAEKYPYSVPTTVTAVKLFFKKFAKMFVPQERPPPRPPILLIDLVTIVLRALWPMHSGGTSACDSTDRCLAMTAMFICLVVLSTCCGTGRSWRYPRSRSVGGFDRAESFRRSRWPRSVQDKSCFTTGRPATTGSSFAPGDW